MKDPIHGKGAPRLNAILELLMPHAQSGVVVDVGCDHGQLTRAIAQRTSALVIGSERMPHRLPRYGAGLNLVVADGIAPLARVDACVIAGMGPHSILGILERGPQPTTAVVHSPDRCDTLRQGLKDLGWRIVEETLAPENDRLAEILRIERGPEPAQGHALWIGPRLLEQEHPLLPQLVQWHRTHWERVSKQAPPGSPGHTRAQGWLDFIAGLPPRLRAP